MQAGIDYDEIFAPVVRMESIRLLFSLSAQVGLVFKQFDITTAFLYGEVKEDLYLQPPEGLDVAEGHTCKLLRSLYGLKQAPRCWNSKFKEILERFGMRPTYSDPCVYISKHQRPLYLALYVDDGLVFAQDERDIDELLGHLKTELKVKEVDNSCFLGLEIEKLADGSIFLHQSRYVARVLLKYNMIDSKGKATPIEPGHHLNDQETLDQPATDQYPYAEALGSLQHCAKATRPDISYPLSVLSKYMGCPREAHWVALKRVIRYLRQTPTHGLFYNKLKEPRLMCFTDADHAGDKENRRSISGLVISIAGGPICYRAQQQRSVAASTTEAEYVAASLGARDIVWLDRFVRELNIQLTVKPVLLCDNQSALKLIKNPEFHQRSKHIDICYHITREKYEEGLFDIEYVRSEDQRADIFTKAFTIQAFENLRKAINCVCLEERNS